MPVLGPRDEPFSRSRLLRLARVRGLLFHRCVLESLEPDLVPGTEYPEDAHPLGVSHLLPVADSRKDLEVGERMSSGSYVQERWLGELTPSGETMVGPILSNRLTTSWVPTSSLIVPSSAGGAGRKSCVGASSGILDE